jgi:hypothetical protein
MSLEIQRSPFIVPATANQRDVCAAICGDEKTPFARKAGKACAHHLYRSGHCRDGGADFI